MKCYRITVEGKTYEVEVEEMGGTAAPSDTTEKSVSMPVSRPSAPVPSAPSPPRAVPSAPPAPRSGSGGGGEVIAPMGGTILSITVKPGDIVAVEDVLLTLEAMKLENEIRAQQGGTVVDILTSEGATVNAGDLLLKIA